MAYDPSKDFNKGFPATPYQARQVADVTASDSTDFSTYPKALYVGVTGDVVVLPVENADGSTVTFKAHPVGYMPVQVRRVLSTGTTATNILALY